MNKPVTSLKEAIRVKWILLFQLYSYTSDLKLHLFAGVLRVLLCTVKAVLSKDVWCTQKGFWHFRSHWPWPL